MARNSNPWYREPMVWMIIAIPLSAVIYGSWFLWVSTQGYDGLVVDDYYKRGKEINKVLVRDHFAAEHGLQAALAFEPATGVVSAELISSDGYGFPGVISLSFMHPTRAGEDVGLVLERGPDGRFFADLPGALREGRWYVQVGGREWRLQGVMRWPETRSLTLKPVQFDPPAG